MKELSIYKKLLKEELANPNSNEYKINFYNQCIAQLEKEIDELLERL